MNESLPTPYLIPGHSERRNAYRGPPLCDRTTLPILVLTGNETREIGPLAANKMLLFTLLRAIVALPISRVSLPVVQRPPRKSSARNH